MKKLLLIFAAVLLMAGYTNKVSAQNLVTKSNSAGGEIMAPLTLVANTPLEFGKLAVQADAGGTIVLTPATATAASATGGVTLMTGTTRTAAKYTVGGTASYVYTITVPSAAVTITGTLPANTMTITGFTFASIASPTGTGGTLTAGGTDNFYVGGTLNVAAAQATGLYSGTFNVSVNYN